MFNHYANGRYGELSVIEWLNQRGYKVVDVSKDKDFFDSDVDLLVYNKSGNGFRQVEVKTDSWLDTYDYKSWKNRENFFIECSTNILDNKAGWIFKTQAERVFIVAEHTGRMFVFNPDEMRDYIKTHRRDLVIKDVTEKTNPNKVSIGALVNYIKYQADGNYLKIIEPVPYSVF